MQPGTLCEVRSPYFLGNTVCSVALRCERTGDLTPIRDGTIVILLNQVVRGWQVLHQDGIVGVLLNKEFVSLKEGGK